MMEELQRVHRVTHPSVELRLEALRLNFNKNKLQDREHMKGQENRSGEDWGEGKEEAVSSWNLPSSGEG